MINSNMASLPILSPADQVTVLGKDSELLAEVRQMFSERLPEAQLQINTAAAAQKWDDARMLLDSLLESVWYCGLPLLQQHIETAQKAVQGKGTLSEELLSKFNHASDVTLRVLMPLH